MLNYRLLKLDQEVRAAGIPIDGVSGTGEISPDGQLAEGVRIDFREDATPTQRTQAISIMAAHTPGMPIRDYAQAIASYIRVWVLVHKTLDDIAQTLPLTPTGAQVSSNLQQQVAAVVTLIQAQNGVVQNIFTRRRWLAGVATATLTNPAAATDAQLRLVIEAARSAANQGIAFTAGVLALAS